MRDDAPSNLSDFLARRRQRFETLQGRKCPNALATGWTVTATSRSYGKAKNSTHHRIQTPNLIEIKFGTVDYVGEATPGAKFHANPSMRGGFLGK